MKGISFFKDRTELVRVKKADSNMKQMSEYFEKQQQLEYPDSRLIKIYTKSRKMLVALLNLMKLRFYTLNNLNFYYRL